MSVANSKTRRAEPRTAADLAERGYKILAVGHSWWPGTPPTREGYRKPQPPMHYKVVRIAHGQPPYDQPWAGLITGPSTRSAAHPRLKSGWFRMKPIGVYESRVAAAHAIIDALEEKS